MYHDYKDIFKKRKTKREVIFLRKIKYICNIAYLDVGSDKHAAKNFLSFM